MTWPVELAAIRARFPDDIVTSPGLPAEPLRTAGEEYEPGVYVDEWGCRFENAQPGHHRQVKDPLIKSGRRRRRPRPPREAFGRRRQVDDFCAASAEFVLAKTWARPSSSSSSSVARRTSTSTWPSARGALRAHREDHGFYKEELELWASTEVDALVFADDWGGQHSLLVLAGALARRLHAALPDYAEIAHRNGKYAFMHSDGHIAAILPGPRPRSGSTPSTPRSSAWTSGRSAVASPGSSRSGGRSTGSVCFPTARRPRWPRAVRTARRALWRGGGAIAQCEVRDRRPAGERRGGLRGVGGA